MDGIVLVGGFGTRLLPLTKGIPKPLIPLANVPFTERTLAWLRLAGLDHIILSLHYNAEQFIDYFSQRDFGMELSFAVEEHPLGTGGAIQHCAQYVRGARCFIFNGDIFTDLKLPAMLEAHRGAGAEISIALTEVEDPSRFGVIETDAARRILSFTEKPPRELARSRAINAGIYLFERAIFARFPDGPCSVERDIFPTLLAEGVHLLGYQEPLYWTDLGTPVDYLQAHLDILTRRVNLPLDYPEVRPGIWQGRDVRIADSACVRPPVLLGDGAVIEAGATVGPAVVLGERTRIGAHAQVEGSVLWAEAVVRRGGRVRGSVLGRGAVVSGLIVDGIFEDFAQVLDTAA